MSAPAIAGGPVLTIRGTHYPVLLPKYRDPRLHLAAVIITLQVLGQTAFDFSLSIAQILVAIGTCGVLEVGIAFFRQRVIMWPASALLTGNGVAFILRVPGTPHGDWWSLHGAWIFAGAAALSLLSKHVIRWRGRHIFNPSNFGLVLCFLVLSESRAQPLDFWWGPMSPWLALAIALIVGGGLTILSRLRLLVIAGAFWLSFAAGIGVLAASGHSMTARWHLGPITGWSFWWLLVTSPEILIFLFFMITDPMTIPKGRVARVVYAVSVGLLATLLIAPQTTEYKTKVAVLGALALICAARPLLERLMPAPGAPEDRAWPWARGLVRHAWVLTLAAIGFAGLVVVAGIPARPDAATASSLPGGEPLPKVRVVATDGISGRVDSATADQIARDIVLDLRANADALRLRDPERASAGAAGEWLADLRQQIGSAAGGPISVPSYRVSSVDLTLTRGAGQGPPKILASIKGTGRASDYVGHPAKLERRHTAAAFKQYLEVALQRGHYVIVQVGETTSAPATPPRERSVLVRATGPLANVRLQDVASQVGLDFRQGAFRYGVTDDEAAMMGGGVCWLDYDNDGWLDLFVVNSFSAADRDRWEKSGGLPRSALFHNLKGSFVNVSKRSGADLAVQGEGCVAADFNGDGYTDLLITTTSYDKLLWNNGDGTFTEGAQAARIDSFGWHSGAAAADVNGDGRPDLFVAGYADLNSPVPNAAGFPSSYKGVRDLLYLNEGNDKHGHARFREVGIQAGLESTEFRHGLGALFTDYNGDGRPDLYVANDEDPNQLYENVPWPGGAAADPSGLGFRFEERGAAEGVADPYAGMGIASGDYNGDGRLDLFVSNSRREPYAVYRHGVGRGAPAFRDGRSALRNAYAGSAGWGASWVDLADNGRPNLVLANGDVPITRLAKDAAPIRVLSDLSASGDATRFANVGVDGLRATPSVNGRGLAAADYDNNGTVDIAISSIGGRLVLLRNTGGSGHWLEVALTRSAPGAVATVVLPDGRKFVQELHAGSSYLSSEDPRFHFGLGDATEARTLVIRFPDGGERRFADVRADRLVVVKPPAARPVPSLAPAPSYLLSNCSPATKPRRSVARLWDETGLAVDPGRANPAAQARDLFHLSAAMWDAWVAYDPKGDGYFVTEKHRAGDVQSAREAAISYAAYRLLLWRASYGANVGDAFDRLTATLRSLCYRPGFVSTRGDSPAALGNRIAAAAIAFGQHDGSLEREHYVDSSYTPVNEPLVVSQPGTTMHDRTFWQPLALGEIVVKGGLPIAAKVQSFVASQWGHVRGFSLPTPKNGLAIDPGPPGTGDPSSAAYKHAALDVIRSSARKGGAAIAARWNGPETAPTRWNSIASSVSRGSSAGQLLAADVKLYFALNAALHDAAVATWGAKRTYQSVRPISMIRQLVFQGQSSARHEPSYSPDGLPLVPGLVELITKASSAPGQRHAALAGHVGDIAIRTARGWTLGTRWLPRAGIVTPPYPGWVSDGSAFGRAAAAILTAGRGSPRYRRMADEEGISGVYAGTQIPGDDTAGRRLGSQVGKQAWALAERYFTGTARR